MSERSSASGSSMDQSDNARSDENDKKQGIPLTEDEYREYLKLSDLEKKLDREYNDLKSENSTSASKQEIIKLLHEYNDIKDATQVVLGMIARTNGVTIASLHEEYDLPTAED